MATVMKLLAARLQWRLQHLLALSTKGTSGMWIEHSSQERGLKPDFWVTIALPEENLVQLLCPRVSGHNMLTSHFLQRLRKKENTKTRIYTKVRMHMYFVRAHNMFNSEAVISRKEFFGLLPTSLGGGGDPYKTDSSLSTHHRCCPTKASSCYRRQHLG